VTDVLVVGDVMTDVVVRPSGPLAQDTDRAASIVTRPGGSAANIACWLAACGVSVTLAARVGAADHAAQAADLTACGVIPHLAPDEILETGTVVALIDAAGERSFYTDRAANAGLCAADLPASLLDGVRLLHVSGHAILGGWDAVRGLMAEARARGVTVSVDAGSAGWLDGNTAAFLERVAGSALCFANIAEFQLLWPDGEPTLAGATVIATTDGAALAYDGDQLRVLRVKTIKPVDTVGAGDAFAAGYLAAFLLDADVDQCLGAGNGQAVRAISLVGGRPPRIGRV